MKVYSTQNIRNIALTGHGGSGKTTLAEALVYQSGGSDRLGRVSDGTAITDFDAEEITRKVSLGISLAYAEWKDTKINIIDAPGGFDFEGGTYEAVRAAETVVITVTAKDGIQVGTIKAFNLAKEQGKAILFVITRCEEENADFYKVFQDLKLKFGSQISPVVVPFDKTGKVESYINLVTLESFKYDNLGKPTKTPHQVSEKRMKALRSIMAEAVAGQDEELMLRFFENEGEDFTETEIIKGLHDGVKTGEIIPVVAVSSEPQAAVDKVLDVITYMLPNPLEGKGETLADGKSFAYSESEPFSGFVFKTLADQFVGKLSFVKVVTGQLTSKSSPVVISTGKPERFGKLITLKGKKQEEVETAVAGDIVALTKFSAVTNDTIGADANIAPFAPIIFPLPCYSLAIFSKGKADESKIAIALQKILEEDLTLVCENNAETHERVLSGLGEQHLEVTAKKLKNKFDVEIELRNPTIAYRETIRKKVFVEGKHKKQSGGHGQYGHVKMEFEPAEEDGLVFEERVFGGSVPKNYFPAVEKGLLESIPHGVLAGYPVVRLKATLVDGSYHPVDSSEQAFKMAAHIAYKNGLAQANPTLLEPILSLKVSIPDENTGDIMGILNKRRGSVLGMNSVDGKDNLTQIDAYLPQSEAADFATIIRQITHGLGSFTKDFAHYDFLPEILKADVIANAPKFSEYEG